MLCILLQAFPTGCRFSTSTPEMVGPWKAMSAAGAAASTSAAPEAGGGVSADLPRTAGSSAAADRDAAAASPSSPGANASMGNGAPSGQTGGAGSSGAMPGAAQGQSAAPPAPLPAPANDAGAALARDASSDGAQQAAEDFACALEFATCLLADPLSYAECARMNADHCDLLNSPAPVPDGGSQVSPTCGLLAADCIMRHPEKASECVTMLQACMP